MAMVSGKVTLVTGAAAGIGRATAQIFADEGAKVVVSDIDQTGGEETVSLIKDTGGDAMFVKADISKPEDVAKTIDET
ncbi:SDR family NAD(P)-dependent oxidoreductase [Paracoccus salsus]|uniref:SDR family NAD(P)-dependent oxidoreductase n=1 Tax=Paracoccus salsus TaxID=2911061 RepID=UPI001F2CDFBA|nr:SDR family NAD(P)-dependent oxidoreductase [Paracoccus salsus]MCF3974652.1 SDR family NAD(P)-dependent oxidoreductase [Paracoccus salsus]